jgi:hypothetical protein
LRPWKPREEILEQIRTLLTVREQLVGERTGAGFERGDVFPGEVQVHHPVEQVGGAKPGRLAPGA